MKRGTTGRIDRPLLLEIGLILLLIAVGTVLFLRPAATESLSPRWWHWLVLALLFFGVVGLHTWRAKHRSQRMLREVIREDQMGAADEGNPPA